MEHIIYDELMRRWIKYQPNTGDVYHSKDGDGWAKFRASPEKTGQRIRFEGKKTFVRNLAWRIMIGEWPNDFVVKHKNENNKDTRWSNLIRASYCENSRTGKARINSTTGFVGVYPTIGNKFAYSVTIDHKKTTKYGFSTARDAALARDTFIINQRDQYATLNLLDMPDENNTH